MTTHAGEILLRTHGLSKHFGGVHATDNVNIDVRQGEVHALIGPNGAGKTTLIGLVSGSLMPDTGTITFDSHNIEHLDAPARARLGLARTFQITSIFPEFSVLENVALAVQAHAGHNFSFMRDAGKDDLLIKPARAALAKTGLAERSMLTAGNLAHGEQRQLELAMALAVSPRLILLDEPMAGMGPADGQAMTNYLLSLKGQQSVLLVEHDMSAVFALADRISVLVYGKIIATDTPENIRRNDEVRAAYLGDDTTDSPKDVSGTSQTPRNDLHHPGNNHA